jgi:hypothetical protein
MNRTTGLVVDMFERAATSAGEQFLVIAIGGGALLGATGLPWALALATAAGAALLSLLTSAVTIPFGVLSYWADLTVRVVKAFAQSLLATVGTSEVVDVRSVPWTQALNVAVLMALLALVKGLLAPYAPMTPSLASPVKLGIINTKGTYTR